MPESLSAELLHEVLEGRTFAAFGSPEAQLAALARGCRSLNVPGPGAQVDQRLRARIRAIARDEERPGWREGWWGGVAARPLTQRLAAAAVAVSLVGGGASAATGITPAEFAREAASLVHSVVLNLDPRDGGDVPTEPTPTQPIGTPTPQATTPAPAGAPTATPPPATSTPASSATPDDDDEDDEDEDEGDDNSGPGANSGSGSRSSDDDGEEPE